MICLRKVLNVNYTKFFSLFPIIICEQQNIILIKLIYVCIYKIINDKNCKITHLTQVHNKQTSNNVNNKN